MHALLDSLSAMIVVSALVLMLAMANVRQRQAMVSSTLFYATMNQTENFAQVVQRDFQGMSEVTIWDAASDSLFSFQGRIGQDAALRQIDYERQYMYQEDSTTFYRVVRKVDGVVVGGSGGHVTAWDVDLRNAQGQPLTGGEALSNAHQVHVRFEMTPVADAPMPMRALIWESTFFPPLRSDQQLY